MQSGELTVSGNGTTRIILRGQPRNTRVWFKHDHNPIPCNYNDDQLNWYVDHEDEDPRRHHDMPHIHHDRQWVLIISWNVEGVRDIIWSVSF
jgi:hypothetical protein